MNMDEKLEKHKQDAIQRDIVNKKREIIDAERIIAKCDKELGWYDEEIEIFKGISAVMLEDYHKKESKIEHAWEENPKYWELLKTKQELDNKKKLSWFEDQKYAVQRLKENTTDQLFSLKVALKMQEEPEGEKK